MFRFLFLSFIFMLPTIAKSMPNPEIAAISPQIQTGYQLTEKDFSFQNQAYRLFIAAPKRQQAHEVVYLLDGNSHFPLALNQLDLTKPLPLIVGIGYPNNQAYSIDERTRDYTPKVSGKPFAQGGGAATFLKFIQEQVKPYVKSHYGTIPEHFFGHSFGGLFGLYVLLQQPDLFNDYCLASPSLWWGHGTFLPAQKPWVAKPKSILLIQGEYEEFPERDPQIDAERLARIQQRQKMRPFSLEEFSQELARQGNHTEYFRVEKKDHGGVIPDALKICLSQWQSQN